MSAEAAGVEVIGLVDPFGSGGGSAHGGPWMFRFAFDCWRDAEGVFHPEVLRVEREVSKSELAGLMKRVERCTIIRARVSLGADGAAQLRALVEGSANDPQLEQRLAELNGPVTYSDSAFGTLTLEPRLRSWFCGDAKWQGAPVELMLHAAEISELERPLEVVRRLWEQQASWDARRRECLLRDLLPLKNDGWLDENEAPVTADELLARALLETVSATPEGGVTFWHADGDLFWGHAIEVSGAIDRDELEANIAG